MPAHSYCIGGLKSRGRATAEGPQTTQLPKNIDTTVGDTGLLRLVTERSLIKGPNFVNSPRCDTFGGQPHIQFLGSRACSCWEATHMTTFIGFVILQSVVDGFSRA